MEVLCIIYIYVSYYLYLYTYKVLLYGFYNLNNTITVDCYFYYIITIFKQWRRPYIVHPSSVTNITEERGLVVQLTFDEFGWGGW